MSGRTKLIAIGTVVVVAVGVFVLVWFQPQKLAIDQRVAETLPPPVGAANNKSEGRFLSGPFKPLEHAVSGKAVVIRSGKESSFLRFEDFEVENGPDLVVYLSAGDPEGPPRALGNDVVELGALKGNVGDQNYTIPPGTDLDRYDTAVVWCRRFTVAFAAAELA
jgi:hypothetical protein